MPQIPGYVQAALAPYFAVRTFAVNVKIAVPERMQMVRLIAVAGRPMAVSWMPIGATPDAETVVIHPDYWPPRNAVEFGLVAHELTHIEQYLRNPNFAEDFDWTAQHLPDGAPPQANLWEAEAYAKEARIVRELNRRGIHVPEFESAAQPARIGQTNRIDPIPFLAASCRCSGAVLV